MASSLSRQGFLVLSALAGEPLHGYAVIKEVAGLTDGNVQLRVGTLYGILDRFAAEGVIELDREEVVESRLRRYYRLTSDGQHLLMREAARMASTAEMAHKRLRALGLGFRMTAARA